MTQVCFVLEKLSGDLGFSMYLANEQKLSTHTANIEDAKQFLTNSDAMTFLETHKPSITEWYRVNKIVIVKP